MSKLLRFWWDLKCRVLGHVYVPYGSFPNVICLECGRKF